MRVLDSENLSVSGARVARWEINRPENLSRGAVRTGPSLVPRETPVRSPDKPHGELTKHRYFPLQESH